MKMDAPLHNAPEKNNVVVFLWSIGDIFESNSHWRFGCITTVNQEAKLVETSVLPSKEKNSRVNFLQERLCRDLEDFLEKGSTINSASYCEANRLKPAICTKRRGLLSFCCSMTMHAHMLAKQPF